MPKRVLILGGTPEATALAERLAKRNEIEPVLSLAGRTKNPRVPDVALRQGGFGGAEGLAAYLRSESIDALVDATHPFAAIMGATPLRLAATAPKCSAAGISSEKALGQHHGTNHSGQTDDDTQDLEPMEMDQRPIVSGMRESAFHSGRQNRQGGCESPAASQNVFHDVRPDWDSWPTQAPRGALMAESAAASASWTQDRQRKRYGRVSPDN